MEPKEKELKRETHKLPASQQWWVDFEPMSWEKKGKEARDIKNASPDATNNGRNRGMIPGGQPTKSKSRVNQWTKEASQPSPVNPYTSAVCPSSPTIQRREIK